MFLRRLDLVGFKSFAARTSTELLPGIVVVVGPNGSGKCVTGDSQVTLDDGRDVPIRDLVEAALAGAGPLETLNDGFVARANPQRLRVLSLNPESLKIEPRPIAAFVKRTAPATLLRVRTRSGREVTVTPHHPLFTLNRGRLQTLAAEELKVGVHVALPRHLPSAGGKVALDPVELIGSFVETDRVYVCNSSQLQAWVHLVRREHRTVSRWSAHSGVAQTQILGLLQGQGVNAAVVTRLSTGTSISPPVCDMIKSKGAGHVRIPPTLSPALARLLGLLTAEGTNRRTTQVRFVNTDPAVSRDFAALVQQVFGLPVFTKDYKRPGCTDSIVFSAVLGRLLDRGFGFAIDSCSADKVMAPQLFGAGPDAQWAYLSGLFEGDAYISVGGSKPPYAELTTASPRLAQQTVALLLRLGIFAVIRSKSKYATNTVAQRRRQYHSVFVYGLDQLRLLAANLSFVGAKQTSLDALLQLPPCASNPNLDLVPDATPIVREAVKLAGIKIKRQRIGRPKLGAYVEGRCQASRAGLKEVANQIEELAATPKSAEAQLRTLRTLACSDVYWDTVVAIDELTPSDPWVYDLCVEGSHNFVANNVIVHNSNISDSVLWVLGEQSSKAVRARKPEEVIFAGSASRQPLGMAEVSLVLDNSDGSLPIEYDEVRVTRRLYRSGDSEYLLNGSRVRLKDITQLLLHAGLSPDSYTVIGQGSIDELILQRPDERRVAFENAADIRRHQLRLNDTRSKLAATETNLVRVQDVLAELTPHVRRLKTQADRAERAETFRAELHDLLLRSYRARLSRAHAERRQADDDLLAATTAAQRAEGDSLAGEQALKTIDERLAALDERLAVLRPRADGFREQSRVAERSLAVTRERKAGLGDMRSTLEADLARLQGLLDRLAVEEREAADAVGQSSETSGEPEQLAEARGKLQTEVAAYDAAQQERARMQQALESVDRRVGEAEARLARTEQQLQSLQANLAVDQARQSDREVRLANLEDNIARIHTEAAADGERVEHARVRLAETEAARQAATVELDQAREALRSTSQQADRLQGALAALGAADLSRRDDADLPADWQAALHDLPVLGLARELAEQIRPIDLLLGGYLRRIVVLNGDSAAREAHRRLSTHLKADAPAWAVLSISGLLLASAGERPLEAVGDQGQSALADWAQQVRQLEHERTEAETRRRAAVTAVQAARDGVDDADDAERSAQVALGDVEAHLVELRRAEFSARAELNQVRTEHDRSAHAAAQRSDEQGRATTRALATRTELATARLERDVLTESFRALDERAGALGEQVGQVRIELAALEAAAGRREAERAARQALHARIEAEMASNEAGRELAQVRMAQLDVQQVELAQREGELSHELQAILGEIEPIENELASAEQRRTDLVAERQAVEQHQAVLRAAERGARETREARHVAAQRVGDELERLNAEIDETAELEGEIGAGAAWAEQLRLRFGSDDLTDAQEQFDLEAARRRIAILQRELRAVGGVAESVVSEFRELSERHAFLEHQSADLRAAMAELHSASAELEAHMRDRFASVFSATQAAFQECFSELFGGGEARLVLTEPDDLLRTGIEIVARPPGKKLQGLLSLSGGERALTVVSLLFGLLKINPTPFCVLDEVDAALDEANVQRFANLLADFARRIQFIVVTHNRATMDKADALYGVSMDEQGVSHIFSVRPRDVADESREPSAVS